MNPPASRPFLQHPALGLVLLFAVATAPLSAQRMEVTDRQAAPVVVQSATITTEVTGRIAVTTFDLVFFNPNGRVLEGTFEFPLLDGQSVVRFALDVNGRLREAVPVEKDRGRVVFEEIERRGVDPGLIEQTAGNNYRARIYPLPARGSRRVVIAYQEDVVRGSGEPFYRLNLDFEQPLQHFRLAATVFTGGGSPAEARTTLPLELPAWRDGKFLEIARENFAARGLLELRLPKTERANVLTERLGEKEYFYAEVPIGAAAPLARKPPHVVGLLWDSSGSGRDRDHAREFALLDAWFAALGSVDVRLVRLRDHASAPANFAVHNGEWSALRRELEQTPYDGATSLDGLADDPAVEEWLLFSDGLVNYGTTPAAAKLPFRGAVHAALASPRADPAWLRGLASRQNGEFVNLLELDPTRAAAVLRSQSLRVLSVQHDPEAAAQVFPEPGAPVSAGTLVVTGILRAPAATLRLTLGHNAGDVREFTVAVRSGENPGRLAARAWAAAKIGWLSADLAANREDIRRTSREFGIVTPDTSLIVLETVADYVRYDITPPDELRAEWNAYRRGTAAAVKKTHDDHLEAVVRLFNERIAWWEQKFPKDKPQQPPEDADLAPEAPSRGHVARSRAVAGAQAALMPPSPADTAAPTIAAESTVHLDAFAVQADSNEARFGGSGTLAGARAGAPVALAMAASGVAYDAAPAAARASLDEAKATEGGASAAAPETPAGTITLQRWSPAAGYLDRLRRAPAEQRYAVYLEERVDHARQPGFFLDAAEFFFEQQEADTALRILSNLAELELDDPALLRVLAHRLVQAGRPELAEPVFERVLRLRPEEPQSRRDLALVCAELKHYQRAVDLLWEVVDQPWDARFPEIELIALSELNAIAATCGQPFDLSRIDPRLRKNLPVALRAVLTWDADNCDIDLWVVDPSGETAKYDNPLTRQGGRMSRDFTGGYGPEEFSLHHPQAGTYQVKINYYGDRRQTALGPVTVQVRLITDFGLPTQQEQRITVRLVDQKETLDIGSIAIKPDK
jgi:tetratricopeptide (TPR) repeat protein